MEAKNSLLAEPLFRVRMKSAAKNIMEAPRARAAKKYQGVAIPVTPGRSETARSAAE